MNPRKQTRTLSESTELVSRGRQALMSSISPEFVTLETVTGFLVVRNTPRVTPTDPASKPQ
jgi:hypothetical protein